MSGTLNTPTIGAELQAILDQPVWETVNGGTVTSDTGSDAALLANLGSVLYPTGTNTTTGEVYGLATGEPDYSVTETSPKGLAALKPYLPYAIVGFVVIGILAGIIDFIDRRMKK